MKRALRMRRCPWHGVWLAVLIVAAASLLSPASAQAAVTVPVDTVADTVAVDGFCSLREAIQAANTNATVNECAHNGAEGDTISFNIAGGGPHVINVAAGGLPQITAPVVIDGTTEPDFGADPVVVLNGAGAGAGVDGLSLSGAATGSTIRGLVIQNFNGGGISTLAAITIERNYIGTNQAGSAAASNGLGIRLVAGNSLIGGPAATARNVISANVNNGILVEAGASGALIQGNYIGLDDTGTNDLGNGIAVAPPNNVGILLVGPNTRIGGTGPGQGNVISGNSGSGIQVQAGANDTVIEGNVIGLNVAGTAVPNGQDGVLVNGGQNALIGGIANTTPGGACTGACNVISGNQDTGVTIAAASPGARIFGNIIGLDASGTAERPNQTEGVSLFGATNALVGDTSPEARNVISGNLFNGVQLRASTLTSTVRGNFIGTNSAGTAALSNGGSGVHVSETSVGNTIGGTAGLTAGACTGACNLILGNDSHGVTVTGAGVTGNAVLGNSIDQNGGLGIDLGADGVTPNDADDGDAGPNTLQNFPVITTAQTDGATTQVVGSLTSTANTNGFRVELFGSPTCDGTNGEGRTFLGATTVNTVGNVGAINVASLPATTVGHAITATATNPANNTSEFSACQPVVAAAAGSITVNPTAGLVTTEAGGQANFTVVLTSVPLDNVTIPISSSDTTEGTIPVASLVFTPANALVPQQVTITGADDAILDGPIVYQIVLGPATSTDVSYNGVNPADVAVTNQDNEVAPPGTIFVNPTAGLITTETGGQAVFSVALGTAPIANVTIPVSTSDPTEGTVPVASLVFTPANALVPQQVTITGVDDAVVDGPIAYLVVLGPATSADVAYNGVDPADVSATNVDNDEGAGAASAAVVSQPSPPPLAEVNDPNNDDEEDERRSETEEERRQRARTNAGNRDDEHTEGNVVELRCDAPIPTVVMANRDGNVEVQLIKDAANNCADVAVGDYLEADGEKIHELLFQAHSIDVHRER